MNARQDNFESDAFSEGAGDTIRALFHVYFPVSFRRSHARSDRYGCPIFNPPARQNVMRTLAQHTRLKIAYSNVMPVWFLPFWRLVKGEAAGSFHDAFAALPRHLPKGVRCPTAEELAIVLVDHGLC